MPVVQNNILTTSPPTIEKKNLKRIPQSMWHNQKIKILAALFNFVSNVEKLDSYFNYHDGNIQASLSAKV